MLMKILKRLSEGGAYSNTSMAKEFKIDESLIEQMIIQLKQLGYIEDDSEACNHNCSECLAKCNCCSGSNIEINMLKLTDKGMNSI